MTMVGLGPCRVLLSKFLIRPAGRNVRSIYRNSLFVFGGRWLGLFCLVYLATFAGCGQFSPSESDQLTQPVAIAVGSVNFQSESTVTFTSYGRVDPPRQLQVGAPVSLPLTTIRTAGEKIGKGGVLAQFNTSGLQQQKVGLQNAIAQQGASKERDQMVARLNDLDRQIDAATVVAPFDVVVKSSINVDGRSLELGRVIMNVVETGKPRISTRVPLWVKERLSEESEFWIYIDDELATCTVEDDPTEADTYSSRRLFLKRDSEPNSDSAEYFQSVRIRFDFNQSANGFWVPTSALNAEGIGEWSLFEVESRQAQDETGIAVKKQVNVQGFEGARAFVDGPLDPGSLIIIRGCQKVVSGQRVSISDTTSEQE